MGIKNNNKIEEGIFPTRNPILLFIVTFGKEREKEKKNYKIKIKPCTAKVIQVYECNKVRNACSSVKECNRSTILFSSRNSK